MINKPYAPSCDGNKLPILQVLQQHFADRKRVLEIGSGTGQHAVFFAAEFPYLIWQASDQLEYLPGIRAWLTDANLPNTPSPWSLDVGMKPWPGGSFDAAFTANTIHIMRWQETERMFEGLAAVLVPGAVLVVYGPFNYNGNFTSESNARFDLWLKSQAPHQGVRDFEAVNALAESVGLKLIEDRAMPSNNRCLVWNRAPDLFRAYAASAKSWSDKN